MIKSDWMGRLYLTEKERIIKDKFTIVRASTCITWSVKKNILCFEHNIIVTGKVLSQNDYKITLTHFPIFRFFLLIFKKFITSFNIIHFKIVILFYKIIKYVH